MGEIESQSHPDSKLRRVGSETGPFSCRNMTAKRMVCLEGYLERTQIDCPISLSLGTYTSPVKVTPSDQGIEDEGFTVSGCWHQDTSTLIGIRSLVD